MPRNLRLSKREFDTIGRPVRRLVGECCTLAIYKTPQIDGPRAAFVVSKKVSRYAHDRNKIKRRLRAVVYARVASLRGGYTYVFTGKATAINAPFSYLVKDLEKMLISEVLS